MLSLQMTNTVHWIWDTNGPDYDEGGYVYEWSEGHSYVTVWPKGSFKHAPEPGQIVLNEIIEDYDSKTMTVEMLIAFLEDHERELKKDTELNYYNEPEAWG